MAKTGGVGPRWTSTARFAERCTHPKVEVVIFSMEDCGLDRLLLRHRLRTFDLGTKSIYMVKTGERRPAENVDDGLRRALHISKSWGCDLAKGRPWLLEGLSLGTPPSYLRSRDCLAKTGERRPARNINSEISGLSAVVRRPRGWRRRPRKEHVSELRLGMPSAEDQSQKRMVMSWMWAKL